MPTSRDASGHLRLGAVRLSELAARSDVETPSYVYDVDAMVGEARALRAAFDGASHLIAYAVKANSAGRIVQAFAREGCGADVVSGTELDLALGVGIPPDAIVFSGVAKTEDELDRAIRVGSRGIGAIAVESVEEIARVRARAHALGKMARLAFRINPGLSSEQIDTHAHIATGHDEAKFGIRLEDLGLALTALDEEPTERLELVGLACHTGSQLTVTDAYLEAAGALFQTARDVLRAGHALRFVDTGGGFGIDYGDGCSAKPQDFVAAVRRVQEREGLGGLGLHVQPGRALVAAHGVLLSSVIQTKVADKARWCMIDAGMNDLLRPALYQARHRIVSCTPSAPSEPMVPMRVVGPVCESSDDFGEHELPLEPPRLVAILDAGAYGFTMASRYNGRPLPAEVFLEGGNVSFVSVREPREVWLESRLRSVRAEGRRG